MDLPRREGWFVGDVAPITIMVGSGGPPGDVDLSLVTSATIQALKPNGAIVSWAATLSAQSATGVTLTYTPSATDLDIAGEWIVYALLQPSARRTETERLPVFSRFARS